MYCKSEGRRPINLMIIYTLCLILLNKIKISVKKVQNLNYLQSIICFSWINKLLKKVLDFSIIFLNMKSSENQSF